MNKQKHVLIGLESYLFGLDLFAMQWIIIIIAIHAKFVIWQNKKERKKSENMKEKGTEQQQKRTGETKQAEKMWKK